jgi:hypothetical protein
VEIRTAGPDTGLEPDHTPESVRARVPGRLAGRLFGAVTVVPALLAVAWLLPGLPLLLAGRLSAPPLMFMFSPLAIGLCYLALRQRPAIWPGFRVGHGGTSPETPLAPPARNRKPVPWWAVAATVAVAAAFAAWQIAERSEQIIVVQDPAAYLQVGYWIAHHGSLPIPQQAEAFGGAHPGLMFASANFAPAGSSLVPQLMTGLPLVLAAAVWLGGIPAALVVTPLIGACAVLSFGGLAGRLVGARWAPVAAAALALSLPEQYTSRGPFTEPLAQVLLFGGLCLLIDSLVIVCQPAAAPAQDTTGHADWPGQDRVLAALAGLTLGLIVLIRIDGLSDILPAVPFLGLLVAARQRQAIPFGLGLVVGVGYGLADGYLKARSYLDAQASSLRPLGLVAAVVVLLTLAGVAVARRHAARAWLRYWLPESRIADWLPVAAGAVIAAIFVGFALRPLVRKVAGQYYHDSLYWVIWYIGLPAVLLGAFGLAVLTKRCGRAVLTWTDPDAEAWTWALPLLTAIWVIVTVLWRPAIAPDQPWASRRLVPFVLPGLILAATWAAAWLREMTRQRGGAALTSGVVASCCAAALLIPATLTNLDLGFSPSVSGSGRHLNAGGMAFRRTGAGELTAINGLCTAVGPDASVVILDPLTADRFAQVARGQCDTPTAVMDYPSPAEVGAVVSGIQRVGRRPVLLARDASVLTPYGGGPRQVVSLLTKQDAHSLTMPPASPGPIRYTVWMSNPT